MKTASLLDFYDKVLALAKTKNEDYIEVSTSLTTIKGLNFQAYVNNFGWQHGHSIEDVLNKVEAKMNNREYSPVDVVIETEQKF